jgi:pimeloyl-ACP methyl ester carboxylesterase
MVAERPIRHGFRSDLAAARTIAPTCPSRGPARASVYGGVLMETEKQNERPPRAAAMRPVTTPVDKTHHRTTKVEGIDVFYREAGPKDAPALLLLHGYPTSSLMFRDLIPRLADRYHVVAPDLAGYGFSAAPDRSQFAYTFAHYAAVVDELTRQLGLDRYALYVLDYGAPIGFRLATLNPDKITALVVQNGNAYEEGFGEAFWTPLRAYWRTGAAEEREALRWMTTLKATQAQYTNGVKDTSLVGPEAWTVDQALLDRPGNAEIQLDLFYDYRTNVPLYPAWQAYFRDRKPPTLVVWGQNDDIFSAEAPELYARDNPDAEVHRLDTGHFALQTHGPEIAALMREFLDRAIPRAAAE